MIDFSVLASYNLVSVISNHRIMKDSIYSNKDLVGLALEGDRLKPKKARELEETLQHDPDDIRSRAQLLGYYFTRHHFRKDKRMSWRTHILWMVQNLPDHPFHLNPFTIISKGDDPEGYDLYRALWLQHTVDQPESAKIFANAAVALHFDEPDEGRKLVMRAQQLDGQLGAVKRAVGFLDHLQNHRRSKTKVKH